MKSTFIILEGGEGSGKSTLGKGLHDHLHSEGVPVIYTREPGGTPWGEKIRTMLIQKDDTIDHHLTPAAQLLGHYMARLEHLERVIVPALNEGGVVISDRFEVSSFAYQVHALGDEKLERLFNDLHHHVVEYLSPYRCVYLFCDIAPEVGLARVEKRGDTKTIFDEAELDFHHKVREGMKRAQEFMDPHFTHHTIDASRTKEEVLSDAVAIIKSF